MGRYFNIKRGRFENIKPIKMTKKEIEILVAEARKISLNASPHISNYYVGAAILGKNGKIYKGCNVEFDAFTNTIHAELNAIGAMFTGDCKEPVAIAVYTKEKDPFFPCCLCRQALFEIAGKNGLCVIACNDTKWKHTSITKLVPHGFKRKRKR